MIPNKKRVNGSSTILPYIPKIITISLDDVRRLTRWKPADTQAVQEQQSDATNNNVNTLDSIIFTLNATERAIFTSLVNTSGWLEFRVLTVSTLPRIRYLLYAAISSAGEWVDGMALERLFDCVTSIDTFDHLPAYVAERIDHGLECHRQLSLAHWRHQRQRLLAELDDEINDRYSGKVANLEKRLVGNRKLLRAELLPDSKRSLSEDRATLRKSLIEAEAVEGEAARFFFDLNAQQPECNLQPLFAIAWSVRLAGSSHKQKTKKR